MFSVFGGTEARRHPGHFPWREAIAWTITVLVLGGVAVLAITFTTNIFGSARVDPRQTEDVSIGSAPAIENPPAQVDPVDIPAIQVEWTEIGQARNGEEVHALPIPWDEIDPYQSDQLLRDLMARGINLPPATSAEGAIPQHGLGRYLIVEDKVVIWAYSNYHWSDDDIWRMTYWKAEIPLSELKGQSP